VNTLNHDPFAAIVLAEADSDGITCSVKFNEDLDKLWSRPSDEPQSITKLTMLMAMKCTLADEMLSLVEEAAEEFEKQWLVNLIESENTFPIAKGQDP